MRERFPQNDYLIDEEPGGQEARDVEGTAPCATPPTAPKAADAQAGRRATGKSTRDRFRADLKGPVIHAAFGIGPLGWAKRPGRRGRG